MCNSISNPFNFMSHLDINLFQIIIIFFNFLGYQSD